MSVFSSFRPSLAAGLLGATLAACAGAAATPVPAPDPAAVGRVDYVARARADSARYPYTTADIRFMTGMIAHHAQAIVMARWAETHGAGPAVRRLAARIINAQVDEIGTMQRWLGDRLQPVPEVTAAGVRMGADGHQHELQAHGMLSPAQMEELDRARGLDFDRLFLTYMIQHHKGAVAMVRELFATDGAGQDEIVFKFASDVHVDQATEIARMELMLAELLLHGRAP